MRNCLGCLALIAVCVIGGIGVLAMMVNDMPKPPTMSAERAAAVKERAAKQEADMESSEKVTRANYSKITIGMTVKEVQDILGLGKEAASGEGVVVGMWESRAKAFEVPTVISITFQNGKVAVKAIAP